MDRRSKQLSSEDHGVILAEHERGSSKRGIGQLLDRPASTICMELARGRQGNDSYRPSVARRATALRASIKAPKPFYSPRLVDDDPIFRQALAPGGADENDTFRSWPSFDGAAIFFGGGADTLRGDAAGPGDGHDRMRDSSMTGGHRKTSVSTPQTGGRSRTGGAVAMTRRFICMIRLMRGNTRGSIAVEFALVAPVLMIVLAGVIDIGSAAYVRQSLEARVTTAAEYALIQPELENQGEADDLAKKLLGLVRDDDSDAVDVIVNSACYCPTRSNGQIEWGSAMTCGDSCGASGDVAGQFVRISATARRVSLFPGYAFSDGDTVGASAVLRLN